MVPLHVCIAHIPYAAHIHLRPSMGRHAASRAADAPHGNAGLIAQHLGNAGKACRIAVAIPPVVLKHIPGIAGHGLGRWGLIEPLVAITAP